MEQEYLTIKEAVGHTGRSEETLRRWVRTTRSQFLVNLEDTNAELEQKTTFLRKRNEVQPDGAPRKDKNGLPIFDWLLLRQALEMSFPTDKGHDNAPSDSGDTNDNPQTISGELRMRPLMERVVALQERAESQPAKAPAPPWLSGVELEDGAAPWWKMLPTRSGW